VPRAPASAAPPAPATPPEAAAPPEAAPAPKNEALVRLKKRSRAVVALAPSPAFGDLLKEHLQEEGYGRVMVTHNSREFLENLQQPNLALVFIDGNFSTLDALQFASHLNTVNPNLPPIILAVEEASAAVVLAARRNGVSQILIKPYSLDAGFSDLLTQQMGL